jgi:hypothetical protein
MGHNDHLDEDRPELPDEAGQHTSSGFEVDEEWFRAAEPEMRHEVMRVWFHSRYCDPAEGTPYNGAEGGYLYIHGGPYTAEDELYGRFGTLCEDDEIREVIDDVESDGIDEWAPVHHEQEEEYDQRFALELEDANDPLRQLQKRLRQSQEVLTLQGTDQAVELARSLVFTSVIGALEAYLYEIASFWIESDENALRSLVEKSPHFSEQKMSLSEVFARHEGIKKHVKGYLQGVVWHRFTTVKSIFQYALSVDLPSTKEFDDPLIKRHHIVHRSGNDKDGAPVTVTIQEIADLSQKIEVFATELDKRILTR